LELVEGQQYSSNQLTDGKSVHLPYSSLFKGDQQHRKKDGSTRILIVGEAGIGKTILCASIAEDWANGKLFQEFLMVFLLPLNQRGVASAQNLQQLFKNLEFDGEVCSTIATYLMANKKKNILMIADGWDELSESNSSTESFLHRLLFGDFVPSSSLTVVVTSKSAPVAQQSISRFTTVQGFSEETVKSYIQREFSSNPEKVSSITMQLKSNPLLGSICSVPLNLSMICSYCQSCDDSLPSTVPELYEKLAWNLAQLKINGTKEYENLLSNYQDLPDELQQSWSHLCQLAFDKCQADFSQSIASGFLSTELETFGLLKSAAVGSDEVMFSFLCPAFKYYLAVSHLTTQPQSEQLEVIKSMRHINPMFCRFYLSVKENLNSDIVSKVVQKLHHCCKDMCLLSFESKNEIVDREVAKSLLASGSTIMLHAQNAYECVAMVHVLEKIEQPCTVEIGFQKCKLQARQIPKLASVLGGRSKMIQVKGLDLSDNSLSDATIADFFSRASSAFGSLEKLFLRSCDIGEVGLRAIIGALANSSCKSLTQLDLSYNSLSVACLECFQQHIEENNVHVQKMEILILKGSLAEDISVNFLKCFATTLSTKCQRLRRLDLTGNKLGAFSDPEFSAIVSQLTASLGTNFDLRLDDNYMPEVKKNFVTTMQESMWTKGTIDHTFAHGVIVGPGRSGKDTLLKRLTGEGPPDPNTISPSTGILENVVKVEVKKLYAVAGDQYNLNWQKLKYDEEALELMTTTAKDYSYSSDVPRPVTIKYISQKKSEDKKSSLPSKKKSDQASQQDTPKADKPQEPESTSTSDDTDSVEEESKHVTAFHSYLAPVDIFKKAVKLRRMDALREHLESSWSLYLTNTGGQIEFQEYLPLLICGPSIFFVTFPLHRDLDKPYEVRYEYPDGTVNSYSSPSTLMEEILQTLATIYTLDLDEEVTVRPTVFIVGTHRDCLKPGTEEIAQIDYKIQWYVKQTSLYHQGSIQFASDFENSYGDGLIFTVNNLSKDDDDFQKIRFAVQQTVEKRKEFTVQCPSSWLIFSLILREKHKSSRVLRLEDCFKIAQECGISSREELTIALSFIHSRLGLVRYFNVDELNSLIVVDPQILFDKIRDLLLETFSGENANHTEIEDFRQKGIISLAAVKRISARPSEDVQLPLTWLMKVLNHLRLAALFKDEYGGKYFFPSALCHVSKPQDPSAESIPSNTPPKALIAFETGFCPRGIAGALIKCLMTNEMKSKMHWYLLSRKIFRNQVSFNIGTYDVTLKILPTHLEISLDPGEDNFADLEDDSLESEMELAYKEVYTQIDKCMKIVTKLYKKCKYFWAFYCTLPNCKTNPHPAVTASSQPLTLQCKIFHKHTRPPKGYRIWNFYKRGSNA
jgi:GTPase SAR1 family protein